MGETTYDPFLVSGPLASEPKTDRESLASYARRHTSETLNSLLPTRDARRLDRLTENLPLALTSLWGYEFSLHDEATGSDVLLCVHEPGPFRKSLDTDAGWEQVIREPYLSRLRDLAAEWHSADSRLGHAISNLWLEYDYEAMGAGSLTPNVFYGPKCNCHALEKIRATQEIFERLGAASLPRGTLRGLARCMSWLVGGGMVTQIGQMLAREEKGLRVFIQMIPTHGILPFLGHMGYQYCMHPALREQLAWCYQLADSVDLDIDLTEVLGDKIGLECYFDSIEKAEVFLDHLYAQNLCVTEKYQKLRSHLRLICQQEDMAFVHFFSHFKLGFHPVKGWAAKVYLGYVKRGIASQVIRTIPSKPS